MHRMTTPVIGGYPTEWFVNKPHSEFICAICQEVLKNPHCCRNGHSFCFSCISHSLEIRQECPQCRSGLRSDMLFLNLCVRNVVNSMLVKCDKSDPSKAVVEMNKDPTSTEGCSWTGPLYMREQHFGSCCAFDRIDCPLLTANCCSDNGCVGHFLRKDSQKHSFSSVKFDTFKEQCRTSEAENIRLSLDVSSLLRKVGVLEDQIFLAGCDTKILSNGIKFSGTEPDKDHKHTGMLIYGDEKDGSPPKAVYYGDMLNYKPHGEGQKKYLNKGIYVGGWYKGKKSGQGTFTHSSGDVTLGEFIRDKLNGQGKWISADGMQSYMGSFVDGQMSGYGELVGEDFTYDGEFRNNCKHGHGTFTKGNERYTGDWVEDKKNGRGTLTFPDGKVFTGKFVDDKMHGKGEMKLEDGEVVKGVWLHDLKLSKQQTKVYKRARNDRKRRRITAVAGAGVGVGVNGAADIVDDDNQVEELPNHEIAHFAL